jgi:hypothetical protein
MAGAGPIAAFGPPRIPPSGESETSVQETSADMQCVLCPFYFAMSRMLQLGNITG